AYSFSINNDGGIMSYLLFAQDAGFVNYINEGTLGGTQSGIVYSLIPSCAQVFETYEMAEAFIDYNGLIATTIMQIAEPPAEEYPDLYTLYWLDGRRTLISGHRPFHEALMLAGYGGGAIRALDFYASGDNTEYTWDSESRDWINNSIATRFGGR
ncbi:hypothetical protein ACQX7T_15270, partial [Staphylococcus aureus]